MRLVIERSEPDEILYLLLGLILNAQGRYEEARKAFESMVDMRPAHSGALAHVGRTFLR